MGDYKSQHTVTEAYLRGFTANESPNTLWRFDKIDGSCKRSNVEKATVKFYAYSFREADGEWNHEAEKILGQVESLALPLLPKFAQGSALDDVEKDHLALFIATMIRRPATLVEHFQREFLEFANAPERRAALLEKMLPELRERFSEDEIVIAKKALADGALDVSADPAKAMQMQPWFKQAPHNSHLIANMHWQVWRAEVGHNYVTSDAPAYVRREGHYDNPTLVGAARADLNSEIIFPISKNSLLIAKHKPCRTVVRATKTRVQTLNAVTIRMAYKHVFASHESGQVRRLVNLSRDLPSLLPDVNTNFAKRFDKQLRSFRVED
jgi:hypothetical protein